MELQKERKYFVYEKKLLVFRLPQRCWPLPKCNILSTRDGIEGAAGQGFILYVWFGKLWTVLDYGYSTPLKSTLNVVLHQRWT